MSGASTRSIGPHGAAGAAALLVVLLSGCARPEPPRGGEPDRIPPAIVEVSPEAFSVAPAATGPIRIRFNERISERLAVGQLSDAVLVSPETGAVRVEQDRDALTVHLAGGLRPGVVYRVTVRPVIRDLFGNTMRQPFEFVFSTGAAIEETAVAGLVIDRITGRPVPDVRVEATERGEDVDAEVSLVHVARTDSTGTYTLRYLPPGSYALLGYQDRNRNRVLDPSEPRGRTTFDLAPADTAFADFHVMDPDTTPARPTGAEVVDSVTVRLTFTHYLDPDAPLAQVGVALDRADGEPSAPGVLQLLHEHRWVEMRQAAQEPPPPVADPTVPGGPPPAPGPPAAAGADPPTPGAAAQPRISFVGRAPGADTVTASLLGITLPSRVLYAEFSAPLLPEVPYVLRLQGAANLWGIPSLMDSVEVVRAPLPVAPQPPGSR